MMLELLEFHSERIVELRHRAGQHDRLPARVHVNDRKAVLAGKSFEGFDVGRIGAELSVVFLMSQMTFGLIAGSYLAHSLLQLFVLAMAQDDRHFQSLAGVGLSNRSCARQWFSLATDEPIF